ncbi:Gag-pro-like protein [Theobroma cacao]|uniref:Gag-pro-like protein n=1 Tax=Theobroma cacao TaxID=3641 RepID=S1SIR9_THECC|nr:Gag-pro-like protein [Theobroma cacao]
MTHQLDQLEFTYGEPETLKRIEEIAQDWKKTCRVDQGRVTDEVTTGYHTWHDQRVKNVIHPPKNPSKHPVNPEPQDVLLESELTRKRLEKEMMNMKRRHEDELEEVKKETARKVRVALKERDEWQSKFEEVSVANSSLLARIQELQSANNALQHEVRSQGQTIQELKNDCDMLETAMEGYKAQYEAIRQEYFQMRERNNSCTQSLQRKEAEMQWILKQMREVAFRARVMADKTEELRGEILPKDELSERLINHLKMVRDQYDKIKGKKAAGSSGTPEDIQQTETNTDPMYPPGFTPPPARNASIPMPSVGQYPFFGMPIGPPPTYAQQRPIGGASPSDPIFVPDLDDPKEQEKLKCGSVESKDNPDTHKKFDLFEERLRMVEGMGMYCSMDAIELCLVPDVVIPPKFKVSDFEKYDGTKCPVTHITMYCRRMAANAHDDKLLIHCFQDSLTGAAAKWYVQLDRNRIHTWKDLARAFVAQYKHVTDMAPDRLSLQNMEKKTTESFKEYAQRWRNVASQVQPPLTEKETTVMFVNTLRAPYYERLVGSATKNFADMVISGEMIETAIKQGKIE